MFGRVYFIAGKKTAGLVDENCTAILSKEFTVAAVAKFLKRTRPPPIKAVL